MKREINDIIVRGIGVAAIALALGVSASCLGRSAPGISSQENALLGVHPDAPQLTLRTAEPVPALPMPVQPGMAGTVDAPLAPGGPKAKPVALMPPAIERVTSGPPIRTAA